MAAFTVLITSLSPPPLSSCKEKAKKQGLIKIDKAVSDECRIEWYEEA